MAPLTIHPERNSETGVGLLPQSLGKTEEVLGPARPAGRGDAGGEWQRHGQSGASPCCCAPQSAHGPAGGGLQMACHGRRWSTGGGSSGYPSGGEQQGRWSDEEARLNLGATVGGRGLHRGGLTRLGHACRRRWPSGCRR
jgi:hypothetical protein